MPLNSLGLPARHDIGGAWFLMADETGRRVEVFVTRAAFDDRLVEVPEDVRSPSELFDELRAEIELIASRKWDQKILDKHGRVIIDTIDLNPLQF